MYAVRLNDIKIQIKNQDIYVLDFFGDTSSSEIESILSYLADEGFINPEKEVNVFIKSKSFIPRNKKEDKEKN